MAQQIQKKFIGNDQVGASKLLIESGSAVRAMDGATEVELIKVSSSETFINGFKVLETSGLITSNRLPSYVDDIIEANDFASLPVSGETGKIYVTLDTNKQYRWSGSAYVQITSGAVDSVNGETGLVVLDAEDILMLDGVTTVEVKLNGLQDEVDANTTSIADLQLELDETQNGAGLESDGSYLNNLTTNYIGFAANLKNADELLDAQVKVNADGLAQEILDRIADVDAEETRALAAELVLQGNIDTVSGNLAQEIIDRAADVDAEEARALAAEGVLQDNIDVVSDGLAQEILDRAADVDAEETRALAAEAALDVRVTALEGALVPTWTRQKFDLTSTDISNGYVDLAQNAIAESIHAFVDRLAIHQGEDFTISVVGGVTRITFAGDLVSPGQSSLDASDNIYVRYQYLA